MKTRRIIVLGLSTVLATGSLTVMAGEAHYLPRKYTNTGWADPSVWQDGYVPTNSDDVVYITEGMDDETNPTAPVLNGRFYPNKYDVTNLDIDSFGFAPYGFSIYFSATTKVTLRDAANCFANWRMNGPEISFVKKTGTPGPLVLNRIFSAWGMNFDAPAAADEIRIESLFQSGYAKKMGAGKLRLNLPAGKPQLVDLYAGTLDIGHADTADELPTNRYFHIDASAPETLLTYVADGRTFVTNWLDADGKSRRATLVSGMGTPFLNAGTSPSGLPLVSFGGYSKDAADQAEHGPAAAMWLSYQSGIKELFQVVKINGANGWGCYVSQFYEDGYRLVNSKTELMTYGSNDGAKKYWHGTKYARLDGVPFDSECVRDPNRLGIVSAWCESGSGGWYLCGDYGDKSVYGGYSIGEIVAYDRVLTESERQGVIRYLSQKWFAEDESKVWDAGVVAVRGDGTAVNVAAGNRADIHGVRVFDPKRTFTKTGEGTLALEQTYPETATITVEGGEVAWQQTATHLENPQPADGAYYHFDATVADSFVTAEDGTSVLAWKDCRATSTLCATSPASTTPHPYVTQAAVNGLNALDFGTTYETNGAYLKIVDTTGTTVQNILHLFYVWESLTNDKNTVPDAMGGSDWSFLRNNSSNIAGSYYNAIAPLQGGVWRLDGVPTARDGEAYGQGVGSALLVSAAFATELNNVAYIGACRPAASQKKGAVRVAEVIAYTRRLSESEKRATEAYLLKKWRGVNVHPALRTTVAGITFAEGVTPKLNIENGSRTFARVTGAGTLTKAGAGEARVAALDGAFTGLDLRKGDLTIEGDYTAPNAITIRVDKDGVVSGRLVATGAFTLPASGTLTVVYESKAAEAKAPVGTFPFARGATISGGAGWTVLTESPKLARRCLDLVAKEGAFSLTSAPRGFSVIIQ